INMSSQRYKLYEEFTKQYVELFGQTESETEQSKTNDHEISIEYDYGVELIQNYESWSASEFVEQ
ncbi:unnamed protein product, partial [Rotaria sordida]